MLQSQSPAVTSYLTRAADAREQAQRATLKSERTFYERMEQRWLDIAASTASAERVDLFIHTLQITSLPHDACPRCHHVMSVEVVETTGRQEIYTLRCRGCGDTEQRTVVRYTLSDSRSAGPEPAPLPCAPNPASQAPPVAHNPFGA